MFGPTQEKASLADVARAWAAELREPLPEIAKTLHTGFWRGEFERPGVDEPEIGLPAFEQQQPIEVHHLKVVRHHVPGLPKGDDQDIDWLDERHFAGDGLYDRDIKLEYRRGPRAAVLDLLKGLADDNLLELNVWGAAEVAYDGSARTSWARWSASCSVRSASRGARSRSGAKRRDMPSRASGRLGPAATDCSGILGARGGARGGPG